MINTATITENDWLVYHEACRIAMRKRRVNRNCRDDCMSYLLTILPEIWKNYDQSLSWRSFAIFCAKRRILNWFFDEKLAISLSRRGPSRVIAINDCTISGDDILVNRRTREAGNILADSELLNMIYNSLPDTQKKEMIRWFQGGNGPASLTKHHDNMRANIKIRAKKLFQESMPELFSHGKVQSRIKNRYHKRLNFRPGYLGERMPSSRFRIEMSGGVLREWANTRRKKK